MRYFVVQAINFSCKERYKLYFSDFLQNVKGEGLVQNLGINMLAGGMAGVTSLCVGYPFDLVRTRLSADLGSSNR